MNGTSPRFLKAIPLIFILLTALACPAVGEDIQAVIKKAKGGDPEAQFALGIAYSVGKRIPQDHAEGVKWYRKAAEQGMKEAFPFLGYAYESGQGVPQDYSKSVKWYRKAAEQGDLVSQGALARAYFKGQGTPQDYLLAYFWMSLVTSRETGKAYEMAAESREQVAKMLTPEQLMKAQQMTREWGAKHPRK